MATIGQLAVNVVAVTDPFQKGLQNAQKLANGFVTKLTAGATAAGLAFAGMLRWFDSTGSELHDLSVATGIAVEQLSFLKYAAEQSGAGIESITKASRELQAKGIDPNRFEQIATRLAAISSPTQRAAAAFQIFGKKAGSAILPLLRDLPTLKKRFGELGGGFTTEMADQADALGDSFGDLKLSLQNVANAIVMQVAPIVTDFTAGLAENLAGVRDWIAEHGGLVRSIFRVGVVIGGIIGIMYALAKAVKVVKDGIMALQIVSALASRNPLLLALAGLTVVGLAAYQKWGSGPEIVGGGDDVVKQLQDMQKMADAAATAQAAPVRPVSLSQTRQSMQPNSSGQPMGLGKVEQNTDTMARLLHEQNEAAKRRDAYNRSQMGVDTLKVAGARG